MNISDDMDLLVEYNQWVSTRKVSTQDVTPQAFMEDRIKQVAVDRLENALQYIDSIPERGAHHAGDIAAVKSILEGTSVYHVEEVSQISGREPEPGVEIYEDEPFAEQSEPKSDSGT